jgi:hypothetical protein
MSAPKSVSGLAEEQDQHRSLDTSEMIDRLATEMRARSAGELPHAFYVEQVMRQLAGKGVQTSAANDEPAQDPAQDKDQQISVFHAWALSE